jgi:hypothetical protein
LKKGADIKLAPFFMNRARETWLEDLIMRNPKLLIFIFIFLGLIPRTIAHDSLQHETATGTASLDLLVSRVDNYWKLLKERKKLQAMEYILASDREQFANESTPPFSEPRLKTFQFSDNRNHVFVTVIVKRMIPAGPVDWPVVEEWRFENDNWYRDLPRASMPNLRNLKTPMAPLTAEQREAEARKLKEMLRFERSVLDFGKIKQHSEISLSLKYSLEGTEPLRVSIKSAPEIMIQGLKDQNLTPGSNQELTIPVPAMDYDGVVNENIVITAHRNGVDVPFEIALKGFVQTSISALPRILRFNSAKGEMEKEIVVRNNTKSKIELKSFFSESEALAVEPLPAKILPGKQLTLKVKQVRSVSQRNAAHNLEIVLAKPVDNRKSLALTAILNATEGMPGGMDAPVITPEIQELIRKNKITLPNR